MTFTNLHRKINSSGYVNAKILIYAAIMACVQRKLDDGNDGKIETGSLWQNMDCSVIFKHYFKKLSLGSYLSFYLVEPVVIMYDHNKTVSFYLGSVF